MSRGFRFRLVAGLLLSCHRLIATSFPINDHEIVVSDSATTMVISDNLKILKDSFNRVSLADILSHQYDQQFGENHFQFLSRKDASTNFWIRLSIISQLKQPGLYKLELSHYLGVANLYIVDKNGKLTQQNGGFRLQMSDKSVKDASSTYFNLALAQHDSLTLYVHAIPDELFYTSSQVSAVLIPEARYVQQRVTSQLILGIYFGFCILTIIYSLLFYLTVRDRNFLFLAGLVFFVMSGFADAYSIVAERIFTSYPWYYLVRFGAPLLWLPGTVIFYQLFTTHLLNLKNVLPKTNIALWILGAATIIFGLGTGFFVLISTFTIVMFFCTVLLAILYLSFKGNRTAKFLLAANLLFLIGATIASLGFISVLNGNAPLYAALFGSALNLLILSIGITDRVRLLRREKEQAQEESMRNLQEKDKLIRDQNVLLEQKVTERTKQLKETQVQLVQSEKMASLGQLTAGVAHEINNPINFVSGNIGPLKRNMSELIQELNNLKTGNGPNDLSYLIIETNQLLDGIEEGSRRTAEIVKGLRNFSRMDESDLKTVDIHDGIESSLLLLNNKLKHHQIEVVTSYGGLPLVACYPGQLNQVWMNLLTNAIDAIGENGRIFITTSLENNDVRVSIRDTGKGMNEAVMKKIFDPFFTTKEIGKGTGLGLSVSYGIIEKHYGKIEVRSKQDQGTEFIITLPISSVT